MQLVYLLDAKGYICFILGEKRFAIRISQPDSGWRKKKLLPLNPSIFPPLLRSGTE